MIGPRILVVEDNPITRKMLRVTLETEQFTVVEAADGATALDAIDREAPALVVQDYVLPDMTGADLLTQIRHQRDAQALPVILLTGLSSKTTEFAEHGGFDMVLTKPVEPSRLIDVVRELLAVDAGSVRNATLPPRRVLVVDDDIGNRKLAEIHLGLAGYRPVLVASVEAALAAARREPPDVILGDVLMPGLDGFQLCLAVRRDPALAKVPIVLVSSAFTDAADRKLALLVGASDLVLRTPGLDHAIAAIEAACAAGAPAPVPSGAALDQRYLESLRRQIDRQMAHTEELAKRAGIQAAALSMVGALAQALANPREVSAVLGDVLVHCLDAAGLSTGLLYLRDPSGALRVHTTAGIPNERRAEAEAAYGHPELLRLQDAPAAYRVSDGNAAQQAFLKGVQCRSALVVPFVVLGKHYGTLVLASDSHDLGDPAWHTFGRALGAQFGQAVALGKSLSELAESDLLFRSAVEASPNGMILADAHGGIVMVNRQTERMFGYRENELMGKPVEILLPTRHRTAHSGHRAAFAAHPHARPMGAGRELFGLHKSGREIPVEIGLAPVTRGNESFVIASVVDITERRKAEEQIRWLSLAVDQGPTSMVMTDLAGNIEYVNPKFTEVTGYTLDEVRGRNPRILQSGATPHTVYRDLWASITAGRPWHGEILNRKKDGTTYWDAMWVYPIRDSTGKVTRFLALKEDITERKNAEQALRESERRARTLFETVNLIVLGLDREGRVEYANPFLIKTLGYAADEVLGRDWFEFLPDTQRSTMRGALQELMDHERHLHYDNPIVTRAGDERMITWNNTVLRDADGRSSGVISIGEDITERTRSALVQTSTYRIAAAAQTAASLPELLAAVHEIVGTLMPAKNFYIALHDEETDLLDFPYWVDEHDRAPQAARPGNTITAHVLRTGAPLLSHQDHMPAAPHELTWVGTSSVEWLGVPLKADDRTIGVVAVQTYTSGVRYTERDQAILEYVATQVAQAIVRKRGVDALVRNEERFRALVEHSGDAIAVLDASGHVLYASQTTIRVMGVEPQNLIGRNAFDFMHPEDAEVVRRSVTGFGHRPGAIIEVRTRFRHTDGSWRDGEGTLTNRLHDPTVRAMVLNYRDVTDRHRLETQLQQSQKMEAVGRLAGGVAHDFNNVLTAIFGYCDLMTEGLPADSEMRGDLDEVRKAAQRAAGLTRQLLAFSRQQVMQPVVLNLNDSVENLDKMLLRLVGEDVAMRNVLAPDIGNVRADPGQIEQVIMNLVVNARDAMPMGGKLTIETTNAELTEEYAEAHQPVVPGPYVMFAVSDTGTGMTPEVKARLFEPFFTTKEKGKGTGLGLATVYGIVKQSGGYIWAYSEPSHGATFKVYLPRVDAPVEAVLAPELKGTLAGTETILLAEDDEILRPLATSLLTKLGYTVLQTKDGADALARAQAHAGPIQLLVTDVVMPGMSGRDLARQLAVVRPDTRVLFISGYTDDAIVRHGMLEPGLNYLQKPFTPAALARKVREVLGET